MVSLTSSPYSSRTWHGLRRPLACVNIHFKLCSVVGGVPRHPYVLERMGINVVHGEDLVMHSSYAGDSDPAYANRPQVIAAAKGVCRHGRCKAVAGSAKCGSHVHC
jgi:hypothetical protein